MYNPPTTLRQSPYIPRQSPDYGSTQLRARTSASTNPAAWLIAQSVATEKKKKQKKKKNQKKEKEKEKALRLKRL